MPRMLLLALALILTTGCGWRGQTMYRGYDAQGGTVSYETEERCRLSEVQVLSMGQT